MADPRDHPSESDDDLVTSLRRLVDPPLEPVELIDPPAALWERIARATGVDDGPAGGAETTATLPRSAATDAPAKPDDAATAGDAGPAVVPLRPRRRWPAIAAAAAAVALVAGVVLVATADDDSAEEIVSRTVLDPLADVGRGSAELVQVDDGWVLLVDTDELDAGEGYLELWVIDPDVTELLSLGPLRADGRYELPAGFDPSRFPIVDVSIEHFDGDPTHSGDSVLRGQLDL